MEPRLVRLCHARDHLAALQDDLTRIPPIVSGWQPPAVLETGAQALAGWLDATRDPAAAPAPPIFGAVESAFGFFFIQTIRLSRLSAAIEASATLTCREWKLA